MEKAFRGTAPSQGLTCDLLLLSACCSQGTSPAAPLGPSHSPTPAPHTPGLPLAQSRSVQGGAPGWTSLPFIYSEIFIRLVGPGPTQKLSPADSSEHPAVTAPLPMARVISSC